MNELPATMDGTLILSGEQLACHGLQLPVMDPETILLLEVTAEVDNH